MAKVGIGRIWIRAYIPGAPTRPALQVRAYLGDGNVKVVDGYGRWTVIDRPKRRGITEWLGTNPLKVEVPVLIDYFDDKDGLSCERDIRTLEEMAGLTSGGDDHPPLLLWDANAPHDDDEAGHLRWVIADGGLQWGRAWYAKRQPGPERTLRVRQEVTITFMQFVRDSYLGQTGANRNRRRRNRRRRGFSGKGSMTHTVKAGESLTKIAAKRLGDKRRWRHIARLNNIRDPESIRPGQVLKLPGISPGWKQRDNDDPSS